ncbi:CD209 antigen-like protein A [Vipera latastei]
MQILDAVRNFTEVFCTTCPAHWLHFQNGCYFFSFESKPWKIAEQACENEDAHLVILNHGIEQNFLVKNMDKEQVFWIGLSDADRENQWIWVDNTTLSLSFWGKGEPNNAGSGEDCATLRSSGKWNDVACSGKEHWICEKKC